MNYKDNKAYAIERRDNLIQILDTLNRIEVGKIARLCHKLSSPPFSWEELEKMSKENLKTYFNKAQAIVTYLTEGK
jgi:hypothetical protein